MKFIISLCLLASFIGTRQLFAQSVHDDSGTVTDSSDFIVARARIISPGSDLYGSKVLSLGLNIGYSKVLGNRHWGADATIFADALSSQFNFAADKSMTVTSSSAGLSLNPYYVVYPLSSFQLAFSLSLNPGYIFDNEYVYINETNGSAAKTGGKLKWPWRFNHYLFAGYYIGLQGDA